MKKTLCIGLLLALLMMFSCGVQAATYADVQPDDWFADAVNYCSEKGYMKGVSETEFAPNLTMNRAMLVTILYRCAGEPAVESGETPAFPDVEAASWYENAVIWGNENELVKGYEDGTFRPTKAVSREEMMVFIYRYMQFCDKVGNNNDSRIFTSFPDCDKVGNWSAEAVKWCTAQGIIGGANGCIQPAGSSTRAQIATVLRRLDAFLAGETGTVTVTAGEGGTVVPSGSFSLVQGAVLTLRPEPQSCHLADTYTLDGVTSAVKGLIDVTVTDGSRAVSVSFRKIAGDYRSGYGQLVNRSYPIANAANYHPADLKACLYPQSGYAVQYLRADAADAVNRMTTDCRNATGKPVYNRSGYRDHDTQIYLYHNQISKQGGNKYKAGTISAIPGTSEHELGLAMDISIGAGLSNTIGATAQGKWLAAHSYEYGFILRYPPGSEKITGITYEPWHFRFVGVEIATEMRAMGVSTLEEYYGLYLKDADLTPYLPYLK